MKSLKQPILLVLLVFASAPAMSFDSRQSGSPDRFNEMKQKIMTNMQTRMNCVQQANSGEAMKQCRVHDKGKNRFNRNKSE